jgi:hypothetical protein
MELLRRAVRSMLAALEMPDAEGDAIDDLVLRVGHTSKW